MNSGGKEALKLGNKILFSILKKEEYLNAKLKKNFVKIMDTYKNVIWNIECCLLIAKQYY